MKIDKVVSFEIHLKTVSNNLIKFFKPKVHSYFSKRNIKATSALKTFNGEPTRYT